MSETIKQKTLKILIVAMAESVHTARWISQIADKGFDIHLFSYDHFGLSHELLRNVTVHYTFIGTQKNKQSGVNFKGIRLFSNIFGRVARKALRTLFPSCRARQLKKLINEFNPDIIHSLETQKNGYLTLEAKNMIKGKFPKWIHTNWGSDISLFGKLKAHGKKIMKVLENCDYYSCECHRDLVLARQYGFKGKTFPVLPNSGGFDISAASLLRQKGKTSQRRAIMLKGYQGWAGRALVGLGALEKCRELLFGYEIYMFSVASKDVREKAELLRKDYGIRIRIVENDTSHEEILKLHGKARISIGLSISDAISTSLLEAIIMGSFPIQSWTSCADEWIIDGKTGILVPPEDAEIVENALRKALTDDDLVDNAAESNYKLAKDKLDEKIIKPKIIGIYKFISEKESNPNA